MIRKLVRHGDDLALVFDRSLLAELQIDESTPLAVATDGQTLTISPVRDAEEAERQKRFEEALEATIQRYGNVFKRLADHDRGDTGDDSQTT